LRGQYALGLLLTYPLWQCRVRGGDVFRYICDHGDTLLQVFVQQVGAKLRIQNAAGEYSQCNDRQERYNRNE